MQLPIYIPCPNCGAKLKIKDRALLGRKLKCPKCSERIIATPPDEVDEDPFDLDDEPVSPPPKKPSRTRSRPAEPTSSGQTGKKKSKKSAKKSSSENTGLLIAIGGGTALLVGVAIALWMSMGRSAPIAAVSGSSSEAANTTVDQYTAAAKLAEAGERPYLLAAKPFLEAVAARDYATAYKTLSSHALGSTQPEQFVTPIEENHVAQPPIKNVTEQQFVEWMQRMEVARGIPQRVANLHVHTIDPKILAGDSNVIDTMFAIGGMPKEIPAKIRKASIRATVEIKYSDEQVKQIAKMLEISEDQVRSGKLHGDEEDDDLDDKPYLNLKFVLVEEGGELKVGYFEFMPPSMLD